MRPLLLAVAALFIAATASPVSACAPPEPMWALGKTLPVDGAEGVPTNTALLLFPADQQAPGVSVGDWETSVHVMRTADLTTGTYWEEVDQPGVSGRLAGWREGLRFDFDAPLAPETDYTVFYRLGDWGRDDLRTWHFTTGAAPATLPIAQRLKAAQALARMVDEVRCELAGASCAEAGTCSPRVTGTAEHGQVEAQVEISAGDWPEVLLVSATASTEAAARAALAESGDVTVVAAGELNVAVDAGRLSPTAPTRVCTALMVESPAAEQVPLEVRCVEAPAAQPVPEPVPELEPVEATTADGCSAGGQPVGTAWLALGLVGLLRRRRR